MPDYDLFGGRLRSALALAGLTPAPPGPAPTWRLRVRRRAPSPAPGAPLAALEDGETRVSLHALASGWRLAYCDTGVYDVSADGARLAWHPAPGADPELVKADVLGRVLALALHAGGALALHGSAVSVDGAGVVFLAPKHHGKSTLAAALSAAGARLVSDDMAVVEPGPAPRLRPGAPELRLWDDAAHHLRALGLGGTLTRGVKQTLGALPAERVEAGGVPLAAVYLLQPGPDGAREPAVRAPLGGAEAALALLAHAKLAPLLAGPLAAAHLARCAAVARAVPVYTLTVARGLHHLAGVARRVGGWHAPAWAA